MGRGVGGWLSGLKREEGKHSAIHHNQHFTYDGRLHQGPVMVLYMGGRGSNEKVNGGLNKVVDPSFPFRSMCSSSSSSNPPPHIFCSCPDPCARPLSD